MVPKTGQLGNLSQIALDMLNDPAGDINPELLMKNTLGEKSDKNETEEVKVELMDGDEDIEEINSESSNHGEI